MINEQIKDKEIRLIDSDGTQLGIVLGEVAQNMADEKNLDLVKISPTAKPPVCKIMDYSKFRFEQQKREKETRKKQKTVSVKEVRLTPNTGSHDINFKIKQATDFLKDGDKVKVSVRFKGRELGHTEVANKILADISTALGDYSTIEKMPKMEGRSMVMFLTPKS